MLDLKVKMTPSHSIKLKKFKRKLRPNIRAGLSQIGKVLARQAKRNTDGLGFSRNPGRASIYPGIKSGTMHSGIISKMPGGEEVIIGSFVDYIEHVIPKKFGGTYTGDNITGQFIHDTMQQKQKEVLRILEAKIWKPLK